MIKEQVTYKDYNGNQRTEDFYFNFTEAELAEMQLEVDGGLEDAIRQIVNANDTPKIIKLFRDDIFLKAYGQKSPDGRRFMKSAELVEEFVQSPAYSILFMKYATNVDALTEFINNVVPDDLRARIESLSTENKVVPIPNVENSNT